MRVQAADRYVGVSINITTDCIIVCAVGETPEDCERGVTAAAVTLSEYGYSVTSSTRRWMDTDNGEGLCTLLVKYE